MVARLSKTEVARLVARSVETPDEVLLFQASSDEDAAAWVDCINGVLAARGRSNVAIHLYLCCNSPLLVL